MLNHNMYLGLQSHPFLSVEFEDVNSRAEAAWFQVCVGASSHPVGVSQAHLFPDLCSVTSHW